MRQAAFRWLLVLALGAALLVAVLWMASTIDARPPRVASWSLTQHLADDRVALTTSGVEVTFNEPVVRDSAEAAFDMVPPVEGTFSGGGANIVFTPSDPLPLETQFTVRMGAGVTDLAGNVMTDPSEPFEFVTAGRPRIAASLPADGAEEVPLDAQIQLTFTTLMDTGSVDAALRISPRLPHEVRWQGERLTITPIEPLAPDVRYVVSFVPGATDAGGLPLAPDTAISFRTQAGLTPALVVPADRADGVALTGPIALVFDDALDPSTIDDELLTITPAVGGELSLAPLEPPTEGRDDRLRVLRFDPSEPLPANTTFEVEVGLSLRSEDGSQLVDPIVWTFTTGAPTPTLGNQILFVSDRAGVDNVWAMNPDGSNPRQLSSELSPITSYAPAPDGRGFVVGDGRRLIAYDADGTDRRVLTETGFWEFDPAYRPDGRRIIFARIDAETGEGLGLWLRDPAGGAPTPIEPAIRSTPAPGEPVAEPLGVSQLRAPRFSPDGGSLAFVVGDQAVGIADIASGRLMALVPMRALSPPVWLPDGGGIVVSGIPDPRDGGAGRWRAPIAPLDPTSARIGAETIGELAVVEIGLETGRGEVVFEEGAARPAVSSTGALAFVRLDAETRGAGELWATRADRGIAFRPAERSMLVTDATFAPQPSGIVAARVRVAADGSLDPAGIWRLSLDGGEPVQLAEDGRLPRWLP